MKKLQYIFLLAATTLYAEYKPVELDTKLLSSMDGIPRIIDGNAVKTEYQVLNEVAKIQFGKLNPQTKKREGVISCRNEKINLKQLIIEENKVEKELKNFNMSIKDAYKNPSIVANPEVQQHVIDVKNGFADAKRIFKDATFPFLESIQHFKAPVIMLMEECCAKRNMPESLILKWAEAAGDEDYIFEKYMRTAKEFDLFLGDLTTFLKDLIHNCPKAKKQFEEWYLKKN